MAKIPRMHIEGGIFYITSRGDNNEEIFKDQADYAKYLELLKKYKTQYNFKCFSFCILPNHLHLLLELKEDLTISEIMHDLNCNYTKYFNAKYAKKGHLFQERYKMVIVQKDIYLLPLTGFIHLNPLYLGLVKDLKDYPYSSYLSYCGGAQLNKATLGIPMQDEIREINSCLIEAKAKDYTAYLDNIPRQTLETISQELTKKIILGDESFREKIKSSVEKIESENAKLAQGAPSQRLPYIIGIGVLSLICVLVFTQLVSTKKFFFKELKEKDIEINKRLAEERHAIVRDLEEKYAADMVSYQAMAKRMELEKKKVQELESKLEKDKKVK